MLMLFFDKSRSWTLQSSVIREQKKSRVCLREKRSPKGYQFGDFTKSILGKTANALTGDSKEYQFGDITKGLKKKAVDAIKEVSGKEDYEFGDLTRALDKKAKMKVAEFTGKSDYQVGDITKEIFRRLGEGEYKIEDIVFLVKVLATLGADFSPLASVLPARLLLELMNYSLAQDVGSRILETVTQALDKRFKEAITGDANYEIGNLTKKAFMTFIGKDGGEYQFGDLTRTVAQKLKEKDGKNLGMVIDAEIVKELDQWDTALNLEDGRNPELH
jgi:hypothetical protein